MKYIILLILVIILSIYLYKKYTKKIEHIRSNSVSLSNFIVNNINPEKVHKNVNVHMPKK